MKQKKKEVILALKRLRITAARVDEIEKQISKICVAKIKSSIAKPDEIEEQRSKTYIAKIKSSIRKSY